MHQQDLLLFGDQTSAMLATLKNLFCQSKRSLLLQQFLREATDVIQLQSWKLNISERQRFYAFDNLLDLAEDHANQDNPDDLLGTVLSYACRVGELIMYEITSLRSS